MISRESLRIGQKKALKRAEWVKQEQDIKLIKSTIGKYRKTTKRCSCPMCKKGIDKRKIKIDILMER